MTTFIDIRTQKTPLQRIKERFWRELKIKLGYFVEMMSFILTGIMLPFSILWSLIFMFIGSWMGATVTRWIEENTRENMKWGLR